jgi:NADPH:quinone reductase-like Zn-dependent oxidoreductase
MAAEAERLGVGISPIMLWESARSLKCNVSAAQQRDRQDEGMEQIRVSVFAGPSAAPEIRSVPWPAIPKKAGLIKIGACGVCGTDLHILKGHWPKQLPWPFTLGHELGGVLVEVGSEFTEDFMSKPLKVGSKVMIPPLMPCGHCYYCTHYPESANKCLTPVYYGRYLWPAPGSADTELGVFMGLEVGHGETKVYAGVQA